MKASVLLVDDEKNILEGYTRNLRGSFNLTTADSGKKALSLIKEGNLFQVVVSDFKMPEMSGVELLEEIKKISPDTIQIMLTGHAEIQSTIDLINKGKIFRFLTKPCSPDDLKRNIDDAVRQHQLINAERELLGKTLGGSIRVLTDLMALAKPIAFHRAARVRNIVKKIMTEIKNEPVWQLDIAAMLSQMGCVTIPDDILKRAFEGKRMTDYEELMFKNHPVIASDMLKNIPRMETVAEIIKYQGNNFDGTDSPIDDLSGKDIPFGSRILKIAIDYENIFKNLESTTNIINQLEKNKAHYDPDVFEKAVSVIQQQKNTSKGTVSKEVEISNLKEGMYLAEDIITASGTLIGNRGQKISPSMIVVLQNYEKSKQLKSMINIIIQSE